MFFHNTIQEHSLVATGIPWHNRFVRDWYTGCAQPSQGCETSSTLVSRFATPYCATCYNDFNGDRFQ